MKLFFISFLSFLLGCGVVYGIWRRQALAEKRRLLDMEQSLTMQHRQFQEQNRRLSELAEFRHDLRHHTAALQGLVRSGDLPAVEEYLNSLSDQRLDGFSRMCANTVVDAMAQQYLGMAKAQGVAVDALLEIGENAGIPMPDLCVVFGNCLENAMEATLQSGSDKPFIRVRAKETPGWLSLVMENSCPSGSLRSVEGSFFSSKERERVGIGLANVRSIAEKYGGTASFEMADQHFRTAVILFKKDETT